MTRSRGILWLAVISLFVWLLSGCAASPRIDQAAGPASQPSIAAPVAQQPTGAVAVAGSLSRDIGSQVNTGSPGWVAIVGLGALALVLAAACVMYRGFWRNEREAHHYTRLTMKGHL